jgi:hypothetical protein
MSDIFDFGFTTVNEEELEVIQEASASAEQASAEKIELESRLHKLHKTILPLLENLKNNPEKDYIHWPNRSDKIEEFEVLLDQIVKGEK